MGNSKGTRLKPLPIDGYGYGYSRVAWVPNPVWVWTTGSTQIDVARGSDNPSCHLDSHFDAAGREEPSLSRQFVCVCGGGVKWGEGTAGEGSE